MSDPYVVIEGHCGARLSAGDLMDKLVLLGDEAQVLVREIGKAEREMARMSKRMGAVQVEIREALEAWRAARQEQSEAAEATAAEG